MLVKLWGKYKYILCALVAVFVIIIAINLFADTSYEEPVIRDQHNETTLVSDYEVNVVDFGALGDGYTDDTATIQAAIKDVGAQGGGRVLIPEGTYMINAVESLKLVNNTQILLEPHAILQAIATDSANYAVIRINGASNVEVTGGKILGDRDHHTGSEGEWGHGINITGSDRVHIADIAISDCWGDGIYIGSNKEKNYCRDVIVESFTIDNCRRNGITVISSQLLTIRDGTISNTNGTNPQSAICMEPNNTDEYMQDILVENVQAIDSGQYGLLFGFGRYTDTANDVNVILRDFTSINHGAGSYNDHTKFSFSRAAKQIIFE